MVRMHARVGRSCIVISPTEGDVEGGIARSYAPVATLCASVATLCVWRAALSQAGPSPCVAMAA